MDRPVINAMDLIARSLLATSKKWEPYIPNSQDDYHFTLKLLSKLGDITQKNLSKAEDVPTGETKSVGNKNSAQVLIDAQAKKTSHSTPPLTQRTKSSSPLGEALSKLRNTANSSRKPGGIFSRVISGNWNEIGSSTKSGSKKDNQS